MKKRSKWIVLLAIGLASPLATAQAAENISCIEGGYSQDETARLERFYREFRPAALNDDSMPPEILVAITRRAGECAEAHAWSVDAIEDATFYRMSSILKLALDRHSPLTASQTQRLEQVIRAADQARLNDIIGRIFSATMEGQEAEPTEADRMFLGRLLIRTGIPATESNGEFIGAFIAALVMGEQARQRFAAR